MEVYFRSTFRISLENILALVIIILLILKRLDGVMGAPEALAIMEYSFMAWKMFGSGLV